ncbi:unnamed protein product [Fusarium graminearum]|uniref:Chromosome 3, complete genome n=1 Tax=Gibberella zeae (strain ATCC MYA-4620 / CBS 123657 / FGSC 9075 / NRRL 31084 / PH-1) TaxID=229533 RepID=A0A098E4U5_GIBZE|nr:unnamed protein product [Fusarium graminearum]CAG1972307.1 unnamed protein product [Fusarium graminearum]CEF88238.1 unnamed protein product [Fusarium graminearum]CZS84708.1 unnamed protein product [Fusarium graminearum]
MDAPNSTTRTLPSKELEKLSLREMAEACELDFAQKTIEMWLWKVFRETNLAASTRLTDSMSPVKFITTVETSKKRIDSLF